jgi:hypothetical protein
MSSVVSVSPTVQAILDAAQAALDTLLAADPEMGGGWELLDGIDQEQGMAAKSLTVGGTWDPEINSLTTENSIQVQTTEHGAARRITEVTAVSCLAYSGDGVSGFSTHRGNVNAVVGAFRDQLRALTAVDGLPAMATISEQRWAQVLDQAGAGAMALFTVTVRVMP